MGQSNKGLYVPQMEKDSCGTGLIANLRRYQNAPDSLKMLY